MRDIQESAGSRWIFSVDILYLISEETGMIYSAETEGIAKYLPNIMNISLLVC